MGVLLGRVGLPATVTLALVGGEAKAIADDTKDHTDNATNPSSAHPDTGSLSGFRPATGGSLFHGTPERQMG